MGRFLKALTLSAMLAGMLSSRTSEVHPVVSDSYGKPKLLYDIVNPIISPSCKIIVEPGHDERFSGWNKREQKLNLDVSRMLADSLDKDGQDVKLLRNSSKGILDPVIDLNKDGLKDREDEIYARAKFIEKEDPDITIGIHYNGYRLRSSHGPEIVIYGIKKNQLPKNGRIRKHHWNRPQDCLYISEPSYMMALMLKNYLMQHDIKAKIIASDVSMLPMNKDRAFIIYELGYLSNPSDLRKWTAKENQQKVAGILAKFVEENISAIKKINSDYAKKRSLVYIRRPEPKRSDLEDLMSGEFWDSD